ncbi:hypothetical protein CMO96_00180 [Candidatus Woesebacteria bacterium]|nr:hypothetical protein [Candidatus Woesebacteria bacterium]|tara:strand:+ start:145 stop:1014 length:870 start_codon:yes stop_codon:yes gene_type:complete
MKLYTTREFISTVGRFTLGTAIGWGLVSCGKDSKDNSNPLIEEPEVYLINDQFDQPEINQLHWVTGKMIVQDDPRLPIFLGNQGIPYHPATVNHRIDTQNSLLEMRIDSANIAANTSGPSGWVRTVENLNNGKNIEIEWDGNYEMPLFFNYGGNLNDRVSVQIAYEPMPRPEVFNGNPVGPADLGEGKLDFAVNLYAGNGEFIPELGPDEIANGEAKPRLDQSVAWKMQIKGKENKAILYDHNQNQLGEADLDPNRPWHFQIVTACAISSNIDPRTGIYRIKKFTAKVI